MNTVYRVISMRRVVGKVCQLVARLSVTPPSWRVQLYKMLGVKFTESHSVWIGEDVYFDDGNPSLIRVGKWARITTGVKIFTHFFDSKFIPEKGRPYRFYEGEVAIGDYVFIGANVVIAKPVVIGDWSVIGANCVITKDVPPGAIMAGNPARQVGERGVGDRIE